MTEKSFLYVGIDCYGLLLDVAGVHEVLELDDAATATVVDNDYHRDWRGAVVRMVNGRSLLGLVRDGKPSAIGVVYSADDSADPPILLEVDRVIALRRLSAQDFQPLPRSPEPVHRLFDGVFIDHARKRQVYRLRRPLLLNG